MSSGDRPTGEALPTVDPTTDLADEAPSTTEQAPSPYRDAPVSRATLLGPEPPRTGECTGAPTTQVTELDAPAPSLLRPAVFPLRPEPERELELIPSGMGAALRKAASGMAKLALVGLLTYGLMFNFSVVRGSSMAPSIHDGDRILVDHLTFLLQGVRRGDIVVLQYPLDPSVDYIKRVIGLPGDEVTIESGRVFVNGTLLDEPYVTSPGRGRHTVRVRPDHYFVLGDNRPHSSDSREFGQVHRDLMRGRVDVRVWPFDRAGRID